MSLPSASCLALTCRMPARANCLVLPSIAPWIALSPCDNKMAATLCKNHDDPGVIALYSLADQKHLGTIVPGRGGRHPAYFSFSPDGKRLAVEWQELDNFLVAGHGARIDVYDTGSRAVVQRLESPVETHHWILGKPAWSPDGEQLAAIQSFNQIDRGQERKPPQLQIWQLDTGDRRSKSLPEGARELAYVADGRQIAVVGKMGIILLDALSLDSIASDNSQQTPGRALNGDASACDTGPCRSRPEESHHPVNSAHNNSACWMTSSVADSCMSGG